jgi:hypothetical protein
LKTARRGELRTGTEIMVIYSAISAMKILRILLSIAFASSIANGQNPKLLGEVQAGTKKAHDAILRNIKIVGIQKSYDMEPRGKYLGSISFEIVANGQNLLCKNASLNNDGSIRSRTGAIINSDEMYSIGLTDNDKYKISWHCFAWKNQSDNRGVMYPYRLINVTSICRAACTNSGTANDYHPDNEQLYPIREVVFDELDGKKVYRITQEMESQDGITPIISYVDATNFLMLREVTKRTLDYKLRKMVDVEQVTDYTYTPNPGGIPFPKSVKGWYVEANGKKLPMTDVEYTEYKRYTPNADEVDMEKQFGISPLPLPPRPELPAAARGATPGTKISRWLYVSAALFAILSAVIVIRARRRAKIGV